MSSIELKVNVSYLSVVVCNSPHLLIYTILFLAAANGTASGSGTLSFKKKRAAALLQSEQGL
jgi:hypothetical protein